MFKTLSTLKLIPFIFNLLSNSFVYFVSNKTDTNMRFNPSHRKMELRPYVYFTQKVPHISIEKYTTNEQERKSSVHKK